MSVKLHNEYLMPSLALGTYSNRPEEPWTDMIKYAFNIGYRHIDSSPLHRNEKIIGEAIAEIILDGEIDREDIFVTSKLWNNKHEKEAVVPALKKTLANLGLQYVDLYMIQWPFSVPDIPGEFFPRGKNNKVLTTETDFKSTWKGMEECVEKGLAKSIGLCNFNIRQIREINFSTRIRPTVVQVECHPYLSQVELINYCRSLEIIVTAYMPQGKKLPPMKGRSLLNDPVLNTLARKYNKTPSQIALRYQLDRGLAVIPKSSKKARLEENFNVFDFSISEKDVLVLDCLNKNERYLDLKEYNQHKHYPFQYDNNDQDILHDAHHDILHDVHHDVHNEELVAEHITRLCGFRGSVKIFRFYNKSFKNYFAWYGVLSRDRHRLTRPEAKCQEGWSCNLMEHKVHIDALGCTKVKPNNCFQKLNLSVTNVE